MSHADSAVSDIQIGKVTQAWAKHAGLLTRYHEECASTNSWAKERAHDEEVSKAPIALYLTELQTQGRGRGNNTWTPPAKGSALYATWSFYSPLPPPILSPLIGLAVFRAAHGTWPFLPWSLKAPNDIYLGPDKCAGLLLENISFGSKNRLLIGLGLNVFEKPKDVPNATCMLDHFPEGVPLLGEDWTQFLDRLLLEITLALSKISESTLQSSDRQSLLWALNKHPSLKTPYSNILPDGTLQQGKKQISWMDL